LLFQYLAAFQEEIMRYMKWVGLAAGILLIVACFLPWVVIESHQITISGVDATGTRFGKPGYLNLLLVVFFLLFHFIPKLWAKRANLIVAGFNTAWVIRNFFLIAVCRGGECPERKIGLYMMLLASLLILVSALFPEMKEGEMEKG
jgi:hypothetical protein